MDPMNLNQLRIFHCAAKLSNFTRAAEELHLTQPGISKHLKALEEYYGAQLFDRLGRKVVLTQAGEALFEATNAAFNLLDQAKTRIDDLSGLMAGKLAIGTSVTIGTYILPEKLVRFRQRYPGIKIKVETALSGQITELVLDNTLELGLVGHYAPDTRLVVEPFMKDPLLLVVSPRHPWAARKTPVPLQELASQTLLVSNCGAGTCRIVDALLTKSGITPEGVVELGTTEGVKEAIAADLGVSLLSGHVLKKELASGVLAALALEGGEPGRDLYLIYRKDHSLSRAARAFLDLLD